MHAAVGLPIVPLTAFEKLLPMSASTPLQLPPEDKLDVLRYLDEFHYWHSLDDKRSCKRCGRFITGRQIIVIGLQGRRGHLRLQCPTAGCISAPSEWVYANPVLAAKSRADFCRVPSKAGMKAVADERIYHGQTMTAQIKRARAKYTAATAKDKHPRVSVRAIAARLNLLRAVASGLHSIQPIA